MRRKLAQKCELHGEAVSSPLLSEGHQVKAARIHEYGGPEVFVLEEIERPNVGAHDVLIKVCAAAVNPVDWKIRSGTQRAIVRLALPAVLGMDVSGIVEEVGADVTEFAVGDEVYGSPHHKRQGGYAEYVAVHAAELARKPANLTHAQAASIPLVGLTSWECLVVKTTVKPGDKVLIHAGAGGVGSFAIQLAKHLGAQVATTCSTRNVDFVRDLGADVVVDYTAQAFDEVLSGYDIVLDAMGGDIKQRSRKVLRRGGTLVTINTGLPAAVRRWGAHLGVLAVGLNLLGFAIGSRLRYGVSSKVAVRRADGGLLAQISELVEQGAIAPVVGPVFSLDQIADAHRQSETGRTRGKIVVDVAG